MEREQLEFQISQYVDGSLSADEVAALQAMLASDAEARALLEDFRTVDASLKRETALPAVNWDGLAERLSDAVAAEDHRLSRAYRISPWWARTAIAAMVLIAIGMIALHLRRPGATIEEVAVTTPTRTQPSGSVVAEISGPAIEVAAAPAVEEVSIGPSPLAERLNYGVAETIVYQTPRVVIASGQANRQDTSLSFLPF